MDKLFSSANAEQDTGTATHLAFMDQPSGAIVGQTLPPVRVAAQTDGGEVDTTYTGAVGLAIDVNAASGARLQGTLVQNAVAGLATFGDLSVDRPGVGYRLVATSGALPLSKSMPFDVESVNVSALKIIAGNGQTDTVGATLPTPYRVRLLDDSGRPVAEVAVTWVVTGGGGSITPSSTSDADGYATATRVLGTTLGDQTAEARVSGVDPVEFRAQATAGRPARLTFVTQPSDTRAGQKITPPVQVVARDRLGNLVTDYDGTVTIDIVPGTGTPGAKLKGDRSKKLVDGIATFNDLSIDRPGLGYRLRASLDALSADSESFNVFLSE